MRNITKIITVFCFSLQSIAIAQWNINTNQNNPICNIVGYDVSSPQIVSDGKGGGIIVWSDNRSGTTTDIYAQRINADGYVQWAIDGIPICTATGNQSQVRIISDGEFGAIMTWVDTRNGNWDIYSQRINEAGIPLWANNGIVICDAQNFQNKPRIIPYQNNGAIISWTDRRNNSTNDDIYTQRIDGNGTIQWAYNGIPVCTDCIESFSTTSIPQIVADNTTQEIFYTWPNLDASETDIYAQKLNSNGIPLWSTNGIPICTSPNIQSKQKSVLDNTGGIIVCWEDNRTNTGNNIFAQRINALGNIQWALNGIEICNAAGYEQNPYMLADGNGGAYIAWEDERFFVKDIYAQKINNNGISQWQANGIPICTAAGTQSGPAIKTINPSGIVIAWEDNRNGSGDIYAQQITNNGNVLWASNGEIITNASGHQYTFDLTNGISNNLIFTWEDNRNGPTDIYATTLNSNGTLNSLTTNSTEQISVYPNPTTSFININNPNNFKINKYIISDMSGKKITELNGDSSSLNISMLSNGLYIMQIHSNHTIFSTKIIKH
ncbi:T9SS type A sorting domain-containing protein [Mariniflexile aquimaris]|uniref:T9SS type A sorting domain-containing protein n=1 Tax=Mariniflexile aquimaris TaxID=881009 RepID=A0ABW3BW16_9FLAO